MKKLFVTTVLILATVMSVSAQKEAVFSDMAEFQHLLHQVA